MPDETKPTHEVTPDEARALSLSIAAAGHWESCGLCIECCESWPCEQGRAGEALESLAAQVERQGKQLSLIREHGWITVICNDFFGFACADGEDVESQAELEAITDAYAKFGQDGAMAWISLKRGGVNPHEYHRGDMSGFYAARAALAEEAGR